jgi:hypothetical protein
MTMTSALISTKKKNDFSSSEQKLHLALSPVLFHIFWWIVILIHLLLAATSSSIAILYYFALPKYSFIQWNLPYFGMRIDPEVTVATIVIMTSFAMWHVYLVGRTFYRSYKAKQLAFRNNESDQARNLSNQSTSIANRSSFGRVMNQLRVFQTVVKQLVGLQGRYFDFVFMLDEATEILIQSYQAYTLSYAAPSIFLNRLLATVVVVNCWSTPLVRYFLRHYESLARFLCMTIDLILDVCACTVVPFLLFLPYYKMYDPSEFNFPDELWYDPKWMIVGRTELGMIHIASWTQLLAQTLPRLSIMMCLQSMSSLVVKKKGSVFSIVPFNQGSTNNTKKDSLLHSRRFKMRLFDGIFILFGAFVLSMHLIATKSANQSVEGCLTRLFPWQVDNRPVCALFEVNCYRNSGIKNGGDADEIHQALENVYMKSISYLGINHCGDVSIPPSIQDLKSLYWFDMYNSTINNWSKEAALTQDHHTQLTTLILLKVHLIKPGLPDGMLSKNFPQSTIDIEISRVNLNFLPDDLGESWTQYFDTFMLEHCGFQTFPEALNDLSLGGDVSFSWNNFTEIPENALADTNYFSTLSLAKNPIQTLPLSFSKYHIHYLVLDGTNITNLPDWVDENFIENTWILAFDTPLCERLLSASSFSSSSGDVGTQVEVEGVYCDDIWLHEYEMFPLAYYED